MVAAGRGPARAFKKQAVPSRRKSGTRPVALPRRPSSRGSEREVYRRLPVGGSARCATVEDGRGGTAATMALAVFFSRLVEVLPGSRVRGPRGSAWGLVRANRAAHVIQRRTWQPNVRPQGRLPRQVAQ
jgi:hypothetical protein